MEQPVQIYLLRIHVNVQKIMQVHNVIFCDWLPAKICRVEIVPLALMVLVSDAKLKSFKYLTELIFSLVFFFFFLFFADATTGNNFTCTCRPGFEGALCDTPFCVAEPCKNGGFCLTTDVAPVCTCSLGYTGVFCETDINECESAPCQNGGECIDLIGQYKCRCDGTGFEGLSCETDIDECFVERINCGERGTCVNTRGSYRYVHF